MNSQPILRDIETRDDCEQLVRAFYERALVDSFIGFLFVDVAKIDLEAHLPIITDYWATMLLGAKSYKGEAFGVHQRLNQKAQLHAGHFERWNALWKFTVDGLFAGENAENAKAVGRRVTRAFYKRLNEPPPTNPQVATGLTIEFHG